MIDPPRETPRDRPRGSPGEALPGAATSGRILVAFEGGSVEWARLEAAAGMAAGLEAELVGLFVEDETLIQAAALPVTRGLSSMAAGPTPIDAALMRRALRVSATKAGEALAAAAARRRLRWSFRVVQAPLLERLVPEIGAGDILALGPVGRAAGRAERALVAALGGGAVPCSLLLLRAAARIDRPVLVLYDGSERVLEAGVRLARNLGRGLAVVAVGASEEFAERRRRDAAGWLERHGLGVAVRPLVATGLEELRQGLGPRHPEILILDRGGALGEHLNMESLLEAFGCTLFILR